MADAITQLSTRLVYENRWLRLREDRVRRLDGAEGIYSVLERADFAVICPYEDGRLHLVQQFRYPVAERVWEFPMGTLEPGEDQDAASLAARELREETGLIAAEMRLIGSLFQAAGYSNQKGHVFLASGLVAEAAAPEPEEQDMRAESFPLAAVERMIVAGEIRDGITIAAFAQARLQGLF